MIIKTKEGIMSKYLESCPLCSGKPELAYGQDTDGNENFSVVKIWCEKCGCGLPFLDAQEAILVWNKEKEEVA